jgi:transcriptional regulator with PAS, ATPase and Fis domain
VSITKCMSVASDAGLFSIGWLTLLSFCSISFDSSALNLPPLRERNDDIPILAKHFIDAYSSQNLQIEDEFFVALSYYYWRGNIRELRNVIERAIVLLDGQQKLSLAQLPEKIVKAYTYKRMKGKLSFIKDKKASNNLMKLGEEIIIETVLVEENYNLSRAAVRLGISRPTLSSKLNSSEKLKKKVSGVSGGRGC